MFVCRRESERERERLFGQVVAGGLAGSSSLSDTSSNKQIKIIIIIIIDVVRVLLHTYIHTNVCTWGPEATSADQIAIDTVQQQKQL